MTRGSHHIIVGDCLQELKKLPAESVHAVVTSPPYFALRICRLRQRVDPTNAPVRPASKEARKETAQAV